MKAILLCVATDGYGAFWDFCMESHKRYCECHEIEYRVVRMKAAGLNGKWTKLLAARELLDAGYMVLLVDTDTEISPSAPHFVWAMADESKSIFVVRGISGRPNSGVMMLRGAPRRQAIEFLDECLRLREQPVDADCLVTAEGENGHVIHVLKREPYAEYCQFLERSWNCSLPEEAGTAHIRHFTNHLRERLESGSWRSDNAVVIVPADPAEAKLQAQWQLHRVTRQGTIRKLDDDPTLLELFRQSVLRSLDNLECPRLVRDDGNDWLWRHEFANGLLERPTAAFLRRLSRGQGVFLDAAAHVGYFSLLMATVAEPPSRIIAIEAHPEHFLVLSRNLSATSAECFHMALADSCGTIELLDGQGHSDSAIHEGSQTIGARFLIEKITVDEIMRRLGLRTLDLARIALEGAEPLAMEGAAETLACSTNIVIVVESNPALLRAGGFAPLGLTRIMERHGLFGREICDDFTLGPSGYIRSSGTVSMAFARKQRWEEIISSLNDC